jgi:tRNA ligase
MAALSPTELIVTSKHALGEIEGSTTSHAQKGEEWLEKHLKKAGRTKLEFAKTLYERNLTAVAEVRGIDRDINPTFVSYHPLTAL